jgi:hypothetical protein
MFPWLFLVNLGTEHREWEQDNSGRMMIKPGEARVMKTVCQLGHTSMYMLDYDVNSTKRS